MFTFGFVAGIAAVAERTVAVAVRSDIAGEIVAAARWYNFASFGKVVGNFGWGVA